MTTLLTVLALQTFSAVAQLETQTLDIRGQFRDAAIDQNGGQFFVAVYDRNSVWRIDPTTGKIDTRVTVGEGPVALAQDGQLLACVNSLSNTVTLISLNDLNVVATVEVGDGPSAIVSLDDGRFVVANTFSDSLSLIDTRGTVAVTTLPGTPAVPAALALTTRHLVVSSRANKTLVRYDRASLNPTTPVAMPETIGHLAPASGDTVIAGSKAAVYLVDLTDGKVLRTEAGRVNGIEATQDTVHVLGADGYRSYDFDLTLRATQPLTGAPSSIAASGNVVAFLDPAAQQVQTSQLNSLRPMVLATAAETAPAATDAPLVVVEATAEEAPATPAEAENVASDDATMTVEETRPAEVLETTAAPAAMPVAAPESDVPAAEDDAPVATETAPNTVEDNTESPSPSQGSENVRHNPISTSGVRAPMPDRPSASPLHQLSQATITEAIVRPTEFGSTEGGFTAPNLTESLKNVKSEKGVRADWNAPWLYTDFQAELGDMKIFANSLTHKTEAPVEVHLKGDVRITQQESSITAESIDYYLENPTPTEAVPAPLTGTDGESATALDQGRLTLQNAHIVEPTREMTADYLDYDFSTGQGELKNAKGQAGIYYFSAEQLHLHGPQTLSGDNVWVTTCDHATPHYKIRLSNVELVDGKPTSGSNARLQLGKADTPLYLPRWRTGGVGGSPWNIDFDSGRQAEIGYYVNVGQQYEVSPDVSVGPRIFATEKAGVGVGGDVYYDFMENPAARLYRTKGEAHGLYTTKDRGYLHLYHRYEYSDDLIVRGQVEHWSDENFYKDHFYDTFRNRSAPRSFVNVTYRQPNYIATGTVRVQSHGWFAETEQLPEATFHLLERNIAENLYFTFDTVNGFYRREPRGVDGGRSVNVARLSYDWDVHPALAITPFLQLDGSLYTRDQNDNSFQGRLSSTAGVTAQSRFSRNYGGRWGFSSFKHVVVPSLTYSYRPSTNLDASDIPQYDPLDSDFGRSRVELKLANVFYGRDAETNEVWQVGRVTLYQGSDFWNETRKTEDYEVEIDVRPRPWWGVQLVAEHQNTSNEDNSLSEFSLARNFPDLYETIVHDLLRRDDSPDFSAQFGDYKRILSQVYYDDTPRGGNFSGRVGFAYTETQGEVFNRDVLYGLGYRFNDKWGLGFEHTYDLEDNDLRSQTYELRRSLHCWETAIRFRDRESGFDINFEFNIKAFPGSRLKF